MRHITNPEEHCGITDYEITCRINMIRMWEEREKQQEKEAFRRWLMYLTGSVIVIVLALVWAKPL